VDDEQYEHRRAPRIQVSWEVQVTRASKDVHIARIDNISEQGAHMVIQTNMGKGEPMVLQMRPLIQGKPHKLQTVAKVVHSRLLSGGHGYGIGLIFHKPSESFQATMGGFILQETRG